MAFSEQERIRGNQMRQGIRWAEDLFRSGNYELCRRECEELDSVVREEHPLRVHVQNRLAKVLRALAEAEEGARLPGDDDLGVDASAGVMKSSYGEASPFGDHIPS